MADRRLTRLGWSEFFRNQLAGESPRPLVARVVEEQRGAYRVAGDFDGWAEVSGKYRHLARTSADFPAVGDWVCLTPTGTSARSSRANSTASARSRERPRVGQPRSRLWRPMSTRSFW